MTRFEHIGVAGAGAWGVALAQAAAGAGRRVTLWGRNAAMMQTWREARFGSHLPGVRLAEAIAAVDDLDALGAADAILVAAPAQATRAMAARLAAALASPRPLIVCAKGIELETNLFLTEVVAEVAPGWPRAVLSGPSFAADVAIGLPTAVTLAAEHPGLAVALASALKGPNLRLYHTTDVRGVELGGAAKNVLAIASGVAAGLGLGASASAALIARGFAELRRFGEAYGARPSTLMGLSGLGDLVLTCSTPQSRNFSFGLALGRGARPDEGSGGKLVEGATTVTALMALAREKHVEMPISETVEALIAGRLAARAAVGALLQRPQKGEN